MTSQIIRITYDGPFRQLSTAPSDFSITVRDLYSSIDVKASQPTDLSNKQPSKLAGEEV